MSTARSTTGLTSTRQLPSARPVSPPPHGLSRGKRAVDEQHPRAAAREADRGRRPRRPGPDDEDVEALHAWIVGGKRRQRRGYNGAPSQGFPSGQRGRAVNPLAQPSEVRILSPALSASAGSARADPARGVRPSGGKPRSRLAAARPAELRGDQCTLRQCSPVAFSHKVAASASADPARGVRPPGGKPLKPPRRYAAGGADTQPMHSPPALTSSSEPQVAASARADPARGVRPPGGKHPSRLAARGRRSSTRNQCTLRYPRSVAQSHE